MRVYQLLEDACGCYFLSDRNLAPPETRLVIHRNCGQRAKGLYDSRCNYALAWEIDYDTGMNLYRGGVGFYVDALTGDVISGFPRVQY